jgi:hypothetical protein
VRGGAGILARAIPFGVGAVIGGAGNNILGRRVVHNSRLAFGPAPLIVPEVLRPVEGPGAALRLGRATGAGVVRVGTVIRSALPRGGVALPRGRAARRLESRQTQEDGDGTTPPATEPTAPTAP